MAAAPFPGCVKELCTPYLADQEWDEDNEAEMAPAKPRLCWKVRCASHTNCPKMICTEHGWGDGCHEGYGTKVEDLSYDARCCKDCNRHFCEDHYYAETEVCKPCTSVQNAQASLGMYNRHCEIRLCSEHAPKVCHDLISETGEECGMQCCSDCMENHRCGYDPTDFI